MNNDTKTNANVAVDEDTIDHNDNMTDDVENEETNDVNIDDIDNTQTDTAELTEEEQIEQLQQQLIIAQEDVLRAKAEAQNSAMRAQQQVERAHKFALDKFASDLLGIVDNLERALESCQTAPEADEQNNTVKAIEEGVALTLKSFVDNLQRHHVEQVNPAIGEPFDPSFHQAVTSLPSDDLEPNSIMVVHQKGYTLNQRLLRPALVVVSAAN